ncbi:dynamin family protein [candidate division KSB1 bacterium]|nr:dynamin family protein [candidate division KSB1 bacterium]
MSSNGFLKEYQQTKIQLGEQFALMQLALAANGTTRLQQYCGSLHERLAANQFNLVVMGQFKRGKSTLINALLGGELLPTAVVPLTSVVTIVRFGESPRGLVYFHDGRRQEIQLPTIADYKTERKNPKNEKQVERVEIEYPAEFLRDGVRLIDTPGVGSVFGHNTDTAYEFLPQADAVLFLVTADPPISETELQFLADVREHAGKIFFVKNKIDHLSPEDLTESLAFTREVLAKDLQVEPAAIKLFPLSAKWALAGRLHNDAGQLAKSRLREIERTLGEFLAHEKGALLLQNTARRAHRLLKEAAGLLELEGKAIATPQAELAKKIAAFQQHQNEIQQQQAALEDLLKGGGRRILENYDDEVVRLKKERLPELAAKLRARFGQQTESSPKKLSAAMEQALREELDAFFLPWRKQQEEKVDREFVALADRLAAQANNAIDHIYQIAGALFDLHLERYEREERLADERYFYFKYDLPASALDDFENLFTYTLAALVTKKIILNKTLARLPELFDRQCGRVRADLFDRWRESSFALQSRLSDRMDEAFREIQSLVERARQQHDASAGETAGRLQELQQRRQQLAMIEEKLLQFNRDGFAEAEITVA